MFTKEERTKWNILSGRYHKTKGHETVWAYPIAPNPPPKIEIGAAVPIVAVTPMPDSVVPVSEPDSEILTSERMKALWAINDAEVESMYKDEALEIVSTVILHMEAAATAGALDSWKYEHPREGIYHARQHLIKILNRYLPHVAVTSKVDKIIFRAMRCQ